MRLLLFFEIHNIRKYLCNHTICDLAIWTTFTQTNIFHSSRLCIANNVNISKTFSVELKGRTNDCWDVDLYLEINNCTKNSSVNGFYSIPMTTLKPVYSYPISNATFFVTDYTNIYETSIDLSSVSQIRLMPEPFLDIDESSYANSTAFHLNIVIISIFSVLTKSLPIITIGMMLFMKMLIHEIACLRSQLCVDLISSIQNSIEFQSSTLKITNSEIYSQTKYCETNKELKANHHSGDDSEIILFKVEDKDNDGIDDNWGIPAQYPESSTEYSSNARIRVVSPASCDVADFNCSDDRVTPSNEIADVVNAIPCNENDWNQLFRSVYDGRFGSEG